MKDFNKEKREMIKEIKNMENFIYNQMLNNIELVDYYDLLKKYNEICMIYKVLKEVCCCDRYSC